MFAVMKTFNRVIREIFKIWIKKAILVFIQFQLSLIEQRPLSS